MAWYLDSLRIFPQTYKDEWDHLIAELNPLAGGSLYHHFGHTDEKRSLTAYVVSNEDIASIRAMISGAQQVTLSGPYGNIDYYVKNASAEPLPRVICQTFHSGKNEDDPVFTVEFEFWRDE